MLTGQKIIPSIGTPIELKDILKGFCLKEATERFEEVIRKKTGRRYTLMTNSGTTAYFLILKVLKRLSDRKEVLLPAYTAPSLTLPIKKAGLVPRFCDIDLKTFNMDIFALNKVVGKDTLAITPVHMFGLPTSFEHKDKGVFMIEDFASALGSEIGGRPVGSFGDVGFVSFNRGKNLSTLTGGAIVTDREDIYKILLKEGEEYLKGPGLKLWMGIILKTIALSLAVRPWFYTIFKEIISCFQYKELHTSFDTYGYTDFQAGLGLSIFKKAPYIFEQRYENGLYLHKRLSNVKGITLPAIPDGSTPVFNQFPLLIDEHSKRDILYHALIEEGIEATTLYPEPVYRAYDTHPTSSGDMDPFPKATYMSRRLLLIPTHPFVKEDDLKKAVDIVLRHL
ncbi:MAG: DegT/DnrJ/EryC1/StrS family aminotransferase [Thermodesulfobacteriota bacterium]